MAPEPTLTVEIARTWDGLPVGPDEVVSLRVSLGPELRVWVDAPFHGDPAPNGAPGPTDKLWDYEVVELFLLGPDGPARPYTEVELGPHGHHQVLQLAGVRRPLAMGLPCALRSWREGARWRAEATVAAELLPNPIVAYNAYAIHGQGAARRYLAHRPVPGPAADFHRLEHFAPWPPRASG